MGKSKVCVGIAWYKKEQWELLKATAADSENIEDTYEEWEKQASHTIKELKKKGQNIEKIGFDVNKFNDWCKKNGKKPDSLSRANYVAELLKEMKEYNYN